jgi:EAL domain-containing protein (putative c-di-GMP-specific phosphodiesterase class I)
LGWNHASNCCARWRHPNAGMVGPGAFVNLLEAHNEITDLTFEILAQSARACRAWQSRGRFYSIAVNLSLSTLNDPDLAHRVMSTLQSAGLSPRHLILEITETCVMTDNPVALENLARLRVRGCGLSVDDFGTGFSSLERLRQIPFTELKIDRGFVAELTRLDRSRVVVESSLDMAQRLGIHSVAEGVETSACLDVLKGAGCEQAQGYLIARPLEADAFAAFIEREAGDR